MTKEEFLLDTLKYYCENTKRICRQASGKCQYDPEVAGNHESEGCAIGRMLDIQTKKLFSETNKSIGAIIMFHPNLSKKLPSWMRKFPREFLSKIQILHDEVSHWDQNGITGLGKKHVERIIEEYNLNPKLFTKYTTIS